MSQLVAELVSSVNGSIEKHGQIVGHMCATCVRVSENVHPHSRTQVQQQVAELVEQHVASVKALRVESLHDPDATAHDASGGVLV